MNVANKCIEAKKSHNHEPNDKNSKIHNFYKKVRIECEKQATKLPKDIFEEMAKDFCAKEDIERKEISFSTIESSCAKRVKNLWPSEIPHTVEDVQEAIDKNREKPVLRYYQETMVSETEMVSFIFGRKELIEEFEKSDEVGQEGTFKTTPGPFRQTYIVTFKYKNHWFPAFVCLMVDKNKITYEVTFHCIYDYLAPKFQGSKMHLELEPESKEATMSQLKKISFENTNRSHRAEMKVKGCMFYYGSCILGNIKKHGLNTKYWYSQPFKNWVRRLMLLCLLPANRIILTWKLHLKNVKFSSFSSVDDLLLKDFKTYFEDQWIFNTETNVLSVFDTEVNSSNENERFKTKLNKKVPTNPHLWNFLHGTNELLDNAVSDLETLKDGKTLVQKEPRMNEEDLKHRKFAEAKLMSKDFTEIQFLDFLIEKFGTQFFHLIKPAEQDLENETVVVGYELDINEDFENVDDFSVPLNHPDTSKINEDITEINSNHRDKEKLEVDKYINKELKCDSYQKTLSCQEEENIFVNIKKPKTEESGLNYEREEPNVNHGIDELSDSEKSNEFMNCDKISLIENSDFYAEGNCQIPLVGTNFTTTKSGKRIVFHHEGYNYNRTRISKKGTCVFLRLVISFLKYFHKIV